MVSTGLYPKDAGLLFPGNGLAQEAVWWTVPLLGKLFIWGIVVWHRCNLSAGVLIWIDTLSWV